MKVFTLLILTFLYFYSCKSTNLVSNRKKESVDEIVSKLNPSDTIDLLDLSYKNIKKLPDLSKFKVRKLNISNNDIDSLDIKNLPNYLEVLDASNNSIAGAISFIYVKKESKTLKNNISKDVREINLSKNKLENVVFFLYDTEINRIILSDNNLVELNLYFNSKVISYLDVSNNKRFSNLVSFDPSKIKTIESKNIAIDTPLKLIEIGIVIPPDKN